MNTISPYLAEFLGTMIMVTIGCGVIATVPAIHNYFTNAPSPKLSAPSCWSSQPSTWV